MVEKILTGRGAPAERKRIVYEYTGFDHATLVKAIRRGWAVNDEVCRLDGVRCIAANERVPSTLNHLRDHVHLTERGRRALADAITEPVGAWVERIKASRGS